MVYRFLDEKMRSGMNVNEEELHKPVIKNI